MPKTKHLLAAAIVAASAVLWGRRSVGRADEFALPQAAGGGAAVVVPASFKCWWDSGIKYCEWCWWWERKKWCKKCWWEDHHKHCTVKYKERNPPPD